MKKMLMRPTAALFPAVLLAGVCFGDGQLTGMLFLFWLAVQLLSLCSVDAFRNAAAREPGVKRVDRRFSGTWIMILLGGALCTAGLQYLQQRIPLTDWMLPMKAALLITIEQLFEERMFALSRRTDGVVLSLISNALLLVGLLLDGSGGVSAPVRGFYTACGAGLGAVISIVANYVIEPMHAFSLKPVNIPFAPKAAVQCLLYPAMIFALYFLAMAESGAVINVMDFAALVSGMLLWRLGRTVCRRSHDESRPLNLLLMAFSGVAVAAACCCGALSPCMDACIVAMICTAAMFCAPGWRIYAGAALVFAGWLVFMLADGMKWIALIPCAIAVILNLHKAFLRKV